MNELPIDFEMLISTYGETSANELVELAMYEGDKLIVAIRGAISRKDAENATESARLLKGMALTMTCFEVSDLAKEIESEVRAGNWEEASRKLQKVNTSLAGVRIHIAVRRRPCEDPS